MANLIEGLQGPRTPQQELFYDLEDAASIIGWSVMALTDMASLAADPGKAAALMKICELMTTEQDKLRGYADEVKAGQITRKKGTD